MTNLADHLQIRSRDTINRCLRGVGPQERDGVNVKTKNKQPQRGGEYKCAAWLNIEYSMFQPSPSVSDG